MQRTDVKHSAFWVRDYNKKKLYSLIRRHVGISRSELTRMIDLTPTSVGKIIAALIEDGLVSECGLAADGKIGRNAIQLNIVPEKVLTMAIEIDVGIIRGGVLDIGQQVVTSYSTSISESQPLEEVTQLLADIIGTLYQRLTPEQQDNLIGLGIAVPGYVDRKNGVIRQSPQLNWKNYPLMEQLQRLLPRPLPVLIENNVKAEAMAELIYGTADKRQNALIIDVGSGVGAAYISRGRVQTGKHNAMGELGHILVGSNGVRCSCGRYGCLRTHIARTSIEERTGMDFPSCVAAAKSGNHLCTEVLTEAAHYAAVWIANCVNLYDPEVIYLGGTLQEDWPEFFTQVKEEYKQYIWEAVRDEQYLLERTYVCASKNNLILSASIMFYQYLMTGVMIDEELIHS